MKECTFRPQTNIAEQGPPQSWHDSSLSLYRRGIRQLARRRALEEEAAIQRERIELAACTFQPSLSKCSAGACGTASPPVAMPLPGQSSAKGPVAAAAKFTQQLAGYQVGPAMDLPAFKPSMNRDASWAASAITVASKAPEGFLRVDSAGLIPGAEAPPLPWLQSSGPGYAGAEQLDADLLGPCQRGAASALRVQEADVLDMLSEWKATHVP